MTNSKYEYVKNFEIQTKLLPETYIVVRIDGKGFTKFCENHNLEKPNDIRLASLMNKAARCLMENFPEIWLAYGQSDEYSFALRKKTDLYSRRAEKIATVFVSCFTSAFVLNFKEFFPDQDLKDVPMFDGRCVLYPEDKIMIDYLCWRQVDCHINNLYNTCFWMLVKEKKMSTEDAHKTLKGTYSDAKNEMLFQNGINYAKIEAIWRKGTTHIRIQDEQMPTDKADEESKENNKIKKKIKTKIIDLHIDMIEKKFWDEYKESLLL